MENMEKKQKLDLISKKYEQAMKIVLEAGKQIKEKSVATIRFKENDISDLVTDCDLACQDYVVNEIRKMHPSDSILSEENIQEISSSNLWILDPIDGTTNFVMQGKNYAISLAYYHEGVPAFGIVYDVEKNDIFHCMRQQGAYKNSTKLTLLKRKSLKESVLDASLKSLMAFQQVHDLDLENLSTKIRAHRSFGCTSLTLCHIAENKKQVFLSNHVKLWDYAAAMILLEEVGGVLDTLMTLTNFDKNQTCIVAASPELLNEVKENIKRWN